jgi:hypothetical protein
MGFKLFILFTTWAAFLQIAGEWWTTQEHQALYWTPYTQHLRQKGWLNRLLLRYRHREHPAETDPEGNGR